MKKLNMTIDEYKMHEEEFNGVCLNCNAIRYGETEGDAENYPCEECGKNAVEGIMSAMISGNILIDGKECV